MGKSAAAIAGAIAGIYPVADAMVREFNSKKAAKLRAEMNTLLSEYNGSINKLRSELERRGIRYNMLMSALENTSPAGSAWRMKKRADKEYSDSNSKINAQINKLTNASELTASDMGKNVDKMESKGFLRTITGDLIG